MEALVIHAPNDLRVESVATDPVQAGQIRVRVRMGGICGSDLHYFQHGGFGTIRIKEPMVLGHEIAGVVDQVADDVTTIAPGYIRTPMTDVNQYKMPFLMDADIFAHKFANAVENKRRFVVIPWQMGWVARFMRLIPPFLWDFAVKKAPHKKRLYWDWL